MSGRDSILDEAERNEDEPEPADESESDTESGEESDRVRITQRLPPDLAADVKAVKKRYNLPSRNAAVNFILTQGIDSLLEDRDR
jgi:hypothetical protein